MNVVKLRLMMIFKNVLILFSGVFFISFNTTVYSCCNNFQIMHTEKGLFPSHYEIKSDTTKLGDNFLAIIKGKQLTIIEKTSKIECTNNNIIRLQDESNNCFSEGFQDISMNDNKLLIVQQICSSKFFIKEIVTYEMELKKKSFVLKQIEYVKTSKADPDTNFIPQKFYKKDFGEISFAQTNLDALYFKLNN
ncbi:hypothetical protein [Aquimarina litoralis]|uniref:hypothetical protein n=1 Tax=Aquimarina litoralis TaxID=584605 RepID=UPI001C582592|nr:hypothetical protein [Aquimarina litoralis]MBW1295648.1 hypothetical protein [Aquimarina litoralis]